MALQRIVRELRPTDVLRRALVVLLAVDWAIAVILTSGMLISWIADPPHAPQTAWQYLYGTVFMFALFSFDAAAFLVVFAALPWALLHLLGARSFWIAPVAGFVVAFGLAFHHTYSIGHQDPRLDTSMEEPDGTPIIVHGRLTPYGETLYGTGAAIGSGLRLGLVGVPFGALLWWLAYPRGKARGRPSDRRMDATRPGEP